MFDLGGIFKRYQHSSALEKILSLLKTIEISQSSHINEKISFSKIFDLQELGLDSSKMHQVIKLHQMVIVLKHDSQSYQAMMQLWQLEQFWAVGILESPMGT